MKELYGLCLIACTIFCAQPDAKDEPDKESKPYYPRLLHARKRKIRLTSIPPVIAFNHSINKPPLPPTKEEISRPATAPYVQLMAEDAKDSQKPKQQVHSPHSGIRTIHVKPKVENSSESQKVAK